MCDIFRSMNKCINAIKGVHGGANIIEGTTGSIRGRLTCCTVTTSLSLCILLNL